MGLIPLIREFEKQTHTQSPLLDKKSLLLPNALGRSRPCMIAKSVTKNRDSAVRYFVFTVFAFDQEE